LAFFSASAYSFNAFTCFSVCSRLSSAAFLFASIAAVTPAIAAPTTAKVAVIAISGPELDVNTLLTNYNAPANSPVLVVAASVAAF